MSVKKSIVGAVITIVIGGVGYTVTKTDIAKNFAKDTGMSQEQAQQYIDSVKEEDLATFDKIGEEFADGGNKLKQTASQIDCGTYKYDWESDTLPCAKGKSQLDQVADRMVALGKAYIKLADESANKNDIRDTINKIDAVSQAYDYEVFVKGVGQEEVKESKLKLSYNKSLLQAALNKN